MTFILPNQKEGTECPKTLNKCMKTIYEQKIPDADKKRTFYFLLNLTFSAEYYIVLIIKYQNFITYDSNEASLGRSIFFLILYLVFLMASVVTFIMDAIWFPESWIRK